MCNYLTLLRPKQTFRPGTQPTIILIFIDNWKLKSKIKTLIEVKQTCLRPPYPLVSYRLELNFVQQHQVSDPYPHPAGGGV